MARIPFHRTNLQVGISPSPTAQAAPTPFALSGRSAFPQPTADDTPLPSFSRTKFGEFDAAEILPAEAAAKFRALKQRAEDLLLLSRAASDQLREAIAEKSAALVGLQRNEAETAAMLRPPKKDDGEIDFAADPAWKTLRARADRAIAAYDRAKILADERGAAFTAAKAISGALERWLERHTDATFEAAPAKAATLRKGETFVQVVDAIRADIAARVSEADALKTAPVSRAEALAAAEAYVARTIEAGAPDLRDIASRHDKPVAWPNTPAEVVTFTKEGSINGRARTTDPIATFAWLNPTGFRERILAAVSEEFPEDALDAGAKAERLAQLAGEIETLERIEERTIATAEANGVEILRRAEASPLAILEIRIRKGE